MFSTKNLSYTALLTTLLIVLGFIPAIPLGFIPVPIVLQNMGVMIIALFLGARFGTLAMGLFFILGLIFPVFSGTKTLIPVLVGPTAGYVIAWFFVPLVLYLCQRLVSSKSSFTNYMIVWLVGVIFVDLIGAIWLSFYTKMPLSAALLSNVTFIPLDTIKAVLTTYLFSRFSHSRLN